MIRHPPSNNLQAKASDRKQVLSCQAEGMRPNSRFRPGSGHGTQDTLRQNTELGKRITLAITRDNYSNHQELNQRQVNLVGVSITLL